MKKGKERREIMGKTAEALRHGVKAVVPKEIERYCSYNGKIRWGIAITAERTILFQDDIFDPMQAIFKVPMLAKALRPLGGI